MSLMNKVKNFFYEDVEEEYEEPVEKESKKKFNPFKKEPKIEENSNKPNKNFAIYATIFLVICSSIIIVRKINKAIIN